MSKKRQNGKAKKKFDEVKKKYERNNSRLRRWGRLLNKDFHKTFGSFPLVPPVRYAPPVTEHVPLGGGQTEKNAKFQICNSVWSFTKQMVTKNCWLVSCTKEHLVKTQMPIQGVRRQRNIRQLWLKCYSLCIFHINIIGYKIYRMQKQLKIQLCFIRKPMKRPIKATEWPGTKHNRLASGELLSDDRLAVGFISS